MNVIRIDNNDLVPLDYSNLLDNILTTLQNQQSKNPFSLAQKTQWLRIDFDDTAFQVASLQVENPLKAYSSRARAATVNFSPGSREPFIEKVQQIRDCLKKLIKSALLQPGSNQSLEEYVTSLITDLAAFQGEPKSMGFTYRFGRYDNLQKQRLSLRRDNPSGGFLKFHKLVLKIENTRQVEEQLKASLKNFINIQFAANTEEERADIHDILEHLVETKDSDFHKLKRLMDTEALAKVQREARVRYLEFLKENLAADRNYIYLEDLIRRLRLIEAYISDRQKADGDYQVNYGGHSFNYKDIFSTSDAFDILPVFSLIAGQLGETTDEERGELQFTFGLKLKFNGKVQTHGGLEVFEYNLNLLNPDSQEHQEGLADNFRSDVFVRKILKIALLYFFVFASRSNPLAEDYKIESELSYEPMSSFEEQILPILQGSDETAKQNLLRKIIKGFNKFNIPEKIKKLKNLLQVVVRRKFQPRTYPISIGVKRGILEQDVITIQNQNTLFKQVFRDSSREDLKYRDALKYISVGDPNADPNFLFTLPANIQISEIEYFSTTDTQDFSMEYDISAGINTIPILITPQENNCIKISQANLQKQKLIVFPYEHQRLRTQIFANEDSPQAFVYRVTFSFLAYTCLKLLFDVAGKWLFIPILRLQLTNKQAPAPEEDFMRSLFASISHLLNEKHRSSSQGFCVKDLNAYKIRNGLTSLYSVLPKKFHFSDASISLHIDKVAIIVVSSRESDASKTGNYKLSNFLGEVVGLQRQSDGSIRLQLLKTFSDNYSSQQIHNNPTVLLDEVSRLYRRGYRHFFYMAKAPYSQTLNLTRTARDEDLFFMSKAIISAFVKDKEDIKIYPIFFDKYYVVKLQSIKASSLYVQDVSELTSLVEDPSKQAVVFFNLFNGITVGEDRYYNGVISYATLLNIYQGLLDDKDIRMGLIYDSQLKNDLLQCLALFHFSKYEASPTKNRNISFKLDPYQNIIGDESVGAKSIFKHMTGGVKFNSLAFLTEVRKALIEQREHQTT